MPVALSRLLGALFSALLTQLIRTKAKSAVFM
jgi:hypothetical protein